MNVTVLLPSFGPDFAGALRHAGALGFTGVDVVALAERPSADLEALADSGLNVVCASLGRGLPEGHALDAVDLEVRRRTVALMKRHIDDAALLGATHAYLVPGLDASADGLARCADACALIADHAAERRLTLCMEHVPGRALPSVQPALDWLDKLRHNNLFLLLDIGHCLISREDSAAMIRQAGARLGYVHCDDNDAAGDLHLPLCTGRLTENDLRRFLAALTAIEYRGALCLELNPENPEPVRAVQDGKALLERLLRADQKTGTAS